MKKIDNIQNNGNNVRDYSINAGELLSIIDNIKEKEKLSLSDIAGKVNLDRSYLSKVINGDPEKKLQASLVRKLRSKFPAYFPHPTQNNTFSREKTTKDTDTQPDGLIGSKEIHSRTIYHLAEGNRIQSETNQTVAETNQKLVDQNIALTQAFTGNADQRTFEETVATVLGLREYLIELAASVMKVSPLEISQALNKKVKAAKEKGDNKGKPVGANM